MDSSMEQIKTITYKEIQAMRANGEVLPPRKGAPEYDMPEGFWDKATVQAPLVGPKAVKRDDG
jgi:hypothetical protein